MIERHDDGTATVSVVVAARHGSGEFSDVDLLAAALQVLSTEQARLRSGIERQQQQAMAERDQRHRFAAAQRQALGY